MPSAAIIIIGNEILSGKFADENAPWLIARLRAIGCDLGRVVTISDTVAGIAEEVARCSAAYTWVLTTGGVGPTHDDLTFEGVALAFGASTHRHPILARVLEEKLGSRCNEAAYKMAEVPVGTELWWDGDFVYPLVVMQNVCIFPGVPALLKLKFDAVAHRFAGVPLSTDRLTTPLTEPEIADTLTAAAARWPAVDIGSYPRFDQRPPVVIVTLESRVPDDLSACGSWLRASLGLN